MPSNTKKNITIEDLQAINEALQSDKTLKEVAQDVLGMTDKTLRKHAKDLGYTYNADNRKFEENENRVLTLEEVTHLLEEMQTRVVALEKAKRNKADGLTLDKKYMQDTVTRSFIVSKQALDKFDSLAGGKLKGYKKQDLITMALLEFIENHK